MLSMVESPNPPAYDRVPLNADAADDAEAAPTSGEGDAPKPISASLRALNRLVYSVGGWRGSFRGFWCFVAYSVAMNAVAGFASVFPFVPTAVGTLLASLALVQLSATWAHVILTPSSPLRFFRRLPPLKKTFEATCFPTLLVWASMTVMTEVPRGVAYLIHLPIWDMTDPVMPEYHWSDSWKGFIIGLVTLVIYVIAVVPATTVLIRVQASLLQPDEDTIVSVDRSFDGTVEPAVVGGKGFVTMKNAFKTVSRESWIRIFVLQAKVFAVGMLVDIVMLAVIIPQVILVSKSMKPKNGD